MIDTKQNINKKINRPYIAGGVLILGLVVLILLMLFSITQGAANLEINTVIDAFTSFDKNNPEQLLVVDMRLPRVIASVFVGVALAVSGAIMQGMTRNPLADSGLMGLSSGAGLALAVCFAFFSGISFTQIIIMSFLGASVGAISVYIISSLVPGENSPMKLVLAGAAVSMLMSALSQGIGIMTKVSQGISFWTMGSVSAVSWAQLKIAIPVISVALIMGLAISRSISILNMGEEVARGLGIKIKLIKTIGTIVVVLLAGTSVALAGTIAFVGMLVPHLSRFIVGPDYRLIIPVSAMLGAILVVLADIGAKTINPPSEIPIGALIALLGVPVFLYFARKDNGVR